MNYDNARSKYLFEFDWTQNSGSPGRPGKRGPAGVKGERGNDGLPGSKGEVPMAVLNTYNEKLEQLEELIHVTSGWMKGSNGYFYMLTDTATSWQSAKTFCEDKKAKLATTGMRNSHWMTWILTNIVVHDKLIWIGLNDLETEGNWVWIDGVQSTSANTFWYRTEPNNIGDEDCAVARREDNTIHDNRCAVILKGLCERVPIM